MSLPKRYNPGEIEPKLLAYWQESGVYKFDLDSRKLVYSIDTPPPTVSGYLHLGHVYSYSHPDFIARFWRMRGYNIFYPMGYDDNGIPTERLVERRLGITVSQVGRATFIQKCLQVSEEAEKDYEDLWKRLGLSIDWGYTYRTIDDLSRHTCQLSFIDLYRKGMAYRREAPAIWCPECHTAIAQAELNDLERDNEFLNLAFSQVDVAKLSDKNVLPVATTRPELLPACVAVFVHPDDTRYRDLVGHQVAVPLFGQHVPVLADSAADPEKGTGAVMCCTFGDVTDVSWWYTRKLPLVQAIDRDGRMTSSAGSLAGLTIKDARKQVKQDLQEGGFLLGILPTRQSVRVHERCDTPVEYLITPQWFIRVLDYRQDLLKAGERIAWHPDHMQARYQSWVENLNWDWCISRQRYYGVPFPLWYCQACGEVILADESHLPVDPIVDLPPGPCKCGNTSFEPERDIFDTWATSSMSPQIVGQWLRKNGLYDKVFPFSLRPQAHEIIRTWAFYTIVKTQYHFHALPWKEALISGWGIAGEGMGKISKSRGGGPMPPLEMIERYSADAVRYWAASTSPGKDSVISEEKIQNGSKLVTKLWNVARFSERFLEGYQPSADLPRLSPADRWILSRSQRLVKRVTSLFEGYEYAAAKNEVEIFFWRDLADNYLEMCKQRLYDAGEIGEEGARYTLYHVLLILLKLFAPLLPYVTEAIYQGIFVDTSSSQASREMSIHRSDWPIVDTRMDNPEAEKLGELLVAIATEVRRYKSDRNLPLGSELDRLQLATVDGALAEELCAARADLVSITRARQVDIIVNEALSPEGEKIGGVMDIKIFN